MQTYRIIVSQQHRNPQFELPLKHVALWPYRIVYLITTDAVEIVTVRHGARLPLEPKRGG